MLYEDWGFSQSPFDQTALPATDLGARLLVGRENQVHQVMLRLQSAPKMPVLEGSNGIGKTSVVNVAAFNLYKRHLLAKGPLYLPCRSAFQLSIDQNATEFVDRVFMEIAQTLIERKQDLLKVSGAFDTKPLDRWLNEPERKTYQGTVYLLSAGMQANINTSNGFQRSGFNTTVRNLLKVAFPVRGQGGIVCCIDNLELLQESERARQMLEELRDPLLQTHGLSWVLCGATGITYSVAASPRLDSFMYEPIEVKDLTKAAAPKIFERRVEAFKERDDYYLPLSQVEFDRLYEVLRGNLRTVLSYTDDYCHDVASDEFLPRTEMDRAVRFEQWLRRRAKSAYDGSSSALTPTTVKVLIQAADMEGAFSPGDYERFGFRTMQNFRPYIKNLEDVNLVVSVRDDTDKRRKTIQITPRGWMTLLHFRYREHALESGKADPFLADSDDSPAG